MTARRRRQRDAGRGSARCGASLAAHARVRGIARPQRTACRGAACTASAVPQAPAPRIVTFMRTSLTSGQRRAATKRPSVPWASSERRRALGQSFLQFRTMRDGSSPPLPCCAASCCCWASNMAWKFDFRQQHRREAGAGADVGDDRAQVRIDHARAGDAEDGLHLVVGRLRISKMPACLASIRNSVRSCTLVVTVAVTQTSKTPSATVSAEMPRLMSTCGCCCSSRIAGELRLLQRHVLQVHALDVEDGIGLLRLGHGGGLPMKQTRSGCGLGRELSRSAVEPGAQQRQATALVERHQVVAAADMHVADEDLRHGAAPGQRDHVLRAAPGSRSTRTSSIAVTPRCLSSALARMAVGADLRGVHANGAHAAR